MQAAARAIKSAVTPNVCESGPPLLPNAKSIAAAARFVCRKYLVTKQNKNLDLRAMVIITKNVAPSFTTD